MKSKISIVLFTLVFSICAFAQMSLPNESQRQEVTQTVGDTKISIVYHRPNTKGREVWGKLVPYGEVWRTGANDNTTFEVTNDVTINGQPLPKGKYGLHTIPNKTEWVFIFSKVNNIWGSFDYDQKNDALRVKVTLPAAPMPMMMKGNKKDKNTSGQMMNESAGQETMSLGFGDVSANETQVVLAWEKLKVGFSVNVGDVTGRTLTAIRSAIDARKPEDARPLNLGARFISSNKLKDNYNEAMMWLDKSIAIKETFGNLSAKARLLGETGKVADAITTGEKAVMVGKASTPAANTADFEKTLAEWKAMKK
jgi:hypothetical protein